MIRELRIGNKLQKDNGEAYTVSKIDNTEDVLVEEQRGLLTLNYNLFGIPLTPEILEKCGFEKKQWTTKGIEITSVYYQLNNIVVYPLKGFFEIELITPAGQFNMFKSWNYLHQLQNLYFALTGEELDVKL